MIKDFMFNFQLEETKDYIFLGEEVRQEIILNLPVYFLCSEECQGLCQFCGGNLNKGECRCH